MNPSTTLDEGEDQTMRPKQTLRGGTTRGVAGGPQLQSWLLDNLQRRVYSVRWAWGIGVVLVLGICILLTSCSDSHTGSTPTPSPAARLVMGGWQFSEGQLANPERGLPRQFQFLVDGTFTCGKTDGTYSFLQERAIVLRYTYGETYTYRFTVSGDTLILDRTTDCGRADHLVYRRAQ